MIWSEGGSRGGESEEKEWRTASGAGEGQCTRYWAVLCQTEGKGRNDNAYTTSCK